MNIRERQYYRINRQLKRAYHQKVLAGANAEEVKPYMEMNARIVEFFAHTGLISHEWAAALGHKHEH